MIGLDLRITSGPTVMGVATEPAVETAGMVGGIGEGDRQGLRQSSRPLPHRLVFQMDGPVRGRTFDELGDEGAPDVVLLDRAEASRNQAPQPGDVSRRVNVASDDSGTEDREASESYLPDRLLLPPHHPHGPESAFGGPSPRRKQRELRDAAGLTTASEPPDDADFEGHQVLLGPLQAALADADAGRSVDGIALRDHASRKSVTSAGNRASAVSRITCRTRGPSAG